MGVFETIPIYLLYFGITLFILLSFEIGFRIGKHTLARSAKDVSGALGPMVGGVLGMLAFILAFTFSMVASHHDHRKQNVLDDANAINTAYLRADLVEEPHKTEIKRLLKEYVDVRLLREPDKESVEKLMIRSAELHNLIWAQALSASKETPGANIGLLIRSINNMFDMHEKRLTTAIRNRIPERIWITLFIISSLTMITLGVQVSISRGRRLVAVIPLALAFAALATIIVDLDRPLGGVITVGQEAMIDLQGKMVQTGK
ncbi:MAG: hypothetical protein GY846_19040 [Deltaproteobacteria bacterium]|nr:hypothetical protein [Deltaproteobacteria bacterium]